MSIPVLLDVTEGVATVTLNRPEARNALSGEILGVLMPDIVDRLAKDDEIRSVVLTGAGGNFCSGGDVKEMGGASSWTYEERTANLRRTLEWVYRLIDLPKPVIAAVDGAAYGAGVSLALAADFLLATPRATFCLVFGRIGLIPDMAATYLLPRRIGVARAKELAFTTRPLSVAEASDLGLIHSIHPPEALQEAATAMAGRLTQASPTALAEAKRLLNLSVDADPKTMLEAELAAQDACRRTAFHDEAVRRFREKQPPLFEWNASAKGA